MTVEHLHLFTLRIEENTVSLLSRGHNVQLITHKAAPNSNFIDDQLVTRQAVPASRQIFFHIGYRSPSVGETSYPLKRGLEILCMGEILHHIIDEHPTSPGANKRARLLFIRRNEARPFTPSSIVGLDIARR